MNNLLLFYQCDLCHVAPEELDLSSKDLLDEDDESQDDIATSDALLSNEDPALTESSPDKV